MLPRCKARKIESTCKKDNVCIWNGTSCNNSDYETYLNICKTNNGKKLILEYAQKLGIDTQKNTIKILCKLISDKLKLLDKNEKIGVKNIFNKMILDSHVAAPIISQHDEIKVAMIVEPSTPISDTASVHKLLRYPMGDRLRFYKHVSKLTEQYKDTLCDFNDRSQFKIVKRIGSDSINGEAYIVSAKYRDANLIVATKFMPKSRKNLNELKLYDRFNQEVIQNKNPHFPIIYIHKICKTCPYEGKILKNKKKECLIAFNELANGDLKTFINNNNITDIQLFSLFAQIIMGSFGFQKAKLIHNDLHWGNILYHLVPQHTDKYTHYKFKDPTLHNTYHDVYIKSAGLHWVLWDFGEAKREDIYRTSAYIDTFRISNLYNWTNRLNPAQSSILQQFSSKIIRIHRILSRLTSENMIIIYHDTLTSFGYDDILLINPKKKPNNIINSQPYIVSE